MKRTVLPLLLLLICPALLAGQTPIVIGKDTVLVTVALRKAPVPVVHDTVWMTRPVPPPVDTTPWPTPIPTPPPTPAPVEGMGIAIAPYELIYADVAKGTFAQYSGVVRGYGPDLIAALP